jgi:GNAT superfamily N-acetyltransferase
VSERGQGPPALIRRARAGEADTLGALALRSKAHWGYDPAFLEKAAADMAITSALLEGAAAFVAERGGVAVGFYILCVEDGAACLRDLWVEPSAIGTGLGKLLWDHMVEEARRLGYRAVRIESDPNAEGFYVRMGARRVGQVPSPVQAGRWLPLLQIDT